MIWQTLIDRIVYYIQSDVHHAFDSRHSFIIWHFLRSGLSALSVEELSCLRVYMGGLG